MKRKIHSLLLLILLLICCYSPIFRHLVASANAQQTILSSFDGVWFLDVPTLLQNETSTLWICSDPLNTTILWGSFGADYPRGFFMAELVNETFAVGSVFEVFVNSTGTVRLAFMQTVSGEEQLVFEKIFGNASVANLSTTAYRADNLSTASQCLYSNASLNGNSFSGQWIGNSSQQQINMSLCVDETEPTFSSANLDQQTADGTVQKGTLTGTIEAGFRYIGYRLVNNDVDGALILFLSDANDVLGWLWESIDTLTPTTMVFKRDLTVQNSTCP